MSSLCPPQLARWKWPQLSWFYFLPRNDIYFLPRMAWTFYRKLNFAGDNNGTLLRIGKSQWEKSDLERSVRKKWFRKIRRKGVKLFESHQMSSTTQQRPDRSKKYSNVRDFSHPRAHKHALSHTFNTHSTQNWLKNSVPFYIRLSSTIREWSERLVEHLTIHQPSFNPLDRVANFVGSPRI